MDTLFYDDHNIYLNGQPYPRSSIRPVYPASGQDNTVSLLFPWWREYNVLWRGDVTRLVDGSTGDPFPDLKSFKIYVDEHFYK